MAIKCKCGAGLRTHWLKESGGVLIAVKKHCNGCGFFKIQYIQH